MQTHTQVDAVRQMVLRTLPPYLCLQLNRFVFDLQVRGMAEGEGLWLGRWVGLWLGMVGGPVVGAAYGHYHSPRDIFRMVVWSEWCGLVVGDRAQQCGLVAAVPPACCGICMRLGVSGSPLPSYPPPIRSLQTLVPCITFAG